MKIFVTGGAGFIGSNFIIKQISETNNSILNLDKLTYAGNLSNLDAIIKSSNYNFVKGDICDYKLILETIFSFKPDCIVHFAAESHVDRSIENPIQFVNTNIIGTTNLLNCSLTYWKQEQSDFRFLHVSTDEVFGSIDGQDLFTEASPYKPNSPYSASKAGADFLVRAWYKTYGFPAFITNCSNNYGPFQFPEKLIPLIIANCINERPLPIYGKGENIRDWIYVKDHCEALDNILENGTIGETYNIGGNNEIKNIDVVNLICTILDDLYPRSNGLLYNELITFVSDRPGHDKRYALDTSKIKTKLSWNQKESFQTGIKKTIQWYLKNQKWWRKIQDETYKQERLGLNVT